MNLTTPQIAVTEPEIQQAITVFTSLWPVVAGAVAKRHVLRQPSNSRGRKKKAQGSRGIQASHRREVRDAILHHQFGRKGCTSLSLRRVAADRGEVGAALKLQSDQEKISESHQLLRADSGDGRAGKTAGSFSAARVGSNQRRGCRCRQSYLPRGAEHRGVSEGHRREPVHG